MAQFRLRAETITAYQYTGTSMDSAVVALLGIDNCVAATATRPALVKNSISGKWMELRPSMWAIISASGIQLVGNQDFVMNYRNVDGEGAILPPIDPGPDVYP